MPDRASTPGPAFVSHGLIELPAGIAAGRTYTLTILPAGGPKALWRMPDCSLQRSPISLATRQFRKYTNRCTTVTRQRCRRQHKVKIFLGRKKPKTQSRVPVTALMAWPRSHIQEQSHRATIRWQHRLKRERPTCTERNDSLLKFPPSRR